MTRQQEATTTRTGELVEFAGSDGHLAVILHGLRQGQAYRVFPADRFAQTCSAPDLKRVRALAKRRQRCDRPFDGMTRLDEARWLLRRTIEDAQEALALLDQRYGPGEGLEKEKQNDGR